MDILLIGMSLVLVVTIIGTFYIRTDRVDFLRTLLLLALFINNSFIYCFVLKDVVWAALFISCSIIMTPAVIMKWLKLKKQIKME